MTLGSRCEGREGPRISYIEKESHLLGVTVCLLKNGEFSSCLSGTARGRERACPGPGPSHCPPLPIHLQVFDNTPAALDGTVAAGDEITGVNGRSIKGKTKVEVAKMIQEVKVRPLWEQLNTYGSSWAPAGAAGPLWKQLGPCGSS